MGTDAMTTDERAEKLPKWARDMIVGLRGENDELKRTLATARGEAAIGSTGKVIVDGIIGEGFPLHDRASISFHLPGGRITCMLRENGTLLDVHSSYGPIHILPRASNCACVRLAQ